MTRGILAATFLLVAAPAAAQSRTTSVIVAGGTGMEAGSGSGPQAVYLRTPVFVEMGARTWNNENPGVAWGGVLRVEVEGRASVAGIPRMELQTRGGLFSVRAFAGVPMFVAPFTMFGLELGVAVRLRVTDGFGLVTSLLADAFVLGSDVPKDSTVLMFNGALGVEFDL